MSRLMSVLVWILALFMVATVFVAVFQESIGWGWWWVLPVGAGFVALIIGFRLAVQRAGERAERLDAELDAAEAAEAAQREGR